ncbi:MAG: GNAT family N-acetyltransferase [Azospirillaceae bacterium]|nr:GNAT family N-acetyltransferase [Azospirillaceae bacterium]
MPGFASDREAALVAALERCAFQAWPALQTIGCDGWLLRFADGFTKRANSVNAVAPTGAFAAVLEMAERQYGQRRQPAIFRLTPLAGHEADAILDQRGYRRLDDSAVMVAPISPALRIDSGVVIRETPSGDWRTGYTDAGAIPVGHRATLARMLAAIAPPAAFAQLVERGQPVAWGLAVVDRDKVGLFDIMTAVPARRRGFGRRLVTSLLAWGRGQGATTAYLQVVTANVPAVALYHSLQFRTFYPYHYRVGPVDRSAVAAATPAP